MYLERQEVGKGDERWSVASLLFLHLQILCQITQSRLIQVVKVFCYGSVVRAGNMRWPPACMEVHHHLQQQMLCSMSVGTYLACKHLRKHKA